VSRLVIGAGNDCETVCCSYCHVNPLIHCHTKDGHRCRGVHLARYELWLALHPRERRARGTVPG